MHLETFIAVAAAQSFSRAAEELGIAQPLLSRRIKNLEAMLGGELFHRAPRQIRLTDFGALLMPYAQDVVDRTDHLRSVAASARSSAVHRLGIPPDCDPASLARLIRGAADRGIAVSLHEAPAAARAAALSEGALALALVRVPSEGAALVIALGLATAGAPAAARGAQALHLDSLRPRRGVDADDPPVLLLMPEDDTPVFTERFDRAMARSGVAHHRVGLTSSTSAAVAEVLAGTAQLLCDGPFARRHGLAWTPLADAELHRGYELAGGPGRDGEPPAGELMERLGSLLAGVVGAEGHPAPPGDDARTRLAARA